MGGTHLKAQDGGTPIHSSSLCENSIQCLGCTSLPKTEQKKKKKDLCQELSTNQFLSSKGQAPLYVYYLGGGGGVPPRTSEAGLAGFCWLH